MGFAHAISELRRERETRDRRPDFQASRTGRRNYEPELGAEVTRRGHETNLRGAIRRAGQLYQAFRRCHGRRGPRFERLRRAPEIHRRGLMHAGHRATRSTALLREKFAVALLVSVLRQRNAGVAALLRAIMHQTILANVEIARAGATSPVVLQALGDVVLELIDAREGLLAQRHDLFENFLLARAQRLQLAVVVMENSDGRSESQL